MKSKNLYVVQFNDSTYWCGYNTVDKQIRKAKIYTSLKYAKEAGDRALEYLNKDSYKILKVELNVTGEVNI